MFSPTNLQVLYGLLCHLKLRITLCPQRSQVGGIKGQMPGVRHQAVIKPGPLFSIPQQRFDGLQPLTCCALVCRRRLLLVTCQEAACQHYVTTTGARAEPSPKGELRVRSPTILWNEARVLSQRHSRALRSVGKIWLVRVSLRVPLFWPEPSIYQRDVKSQPDSAPDFRSAHSRCFCSAKTKKTNKEMEN